MALTEALSNAILYGNRADRSKGVRIRASLDDLALVMEVEDEGSGFDLSRCTGDPSDPGSLEREDGRGLFLMQALMDRVECVEGQSTSCALPSAARERPGRAAASLSRVDRLRRGRLVAASGSRPHRDRGRAGRHHAAGRRRTPATRRSTGGDRDGAGHPLRGGARRTASGVGWRGAVRDGKHFDFLRKYVELKTKIDRALSEGPG